MFVQMKWYYYTKDMNNEYRKSLIFESVGLGSCRGCIPKPIKQAWAYFRLKPMTTYISVFRCIRKYEYHCVFQFFFNLTKYAQVYFTILEYA